MKVFVVAKKKTSVNSNSLTFMSCTNHALLESLGNWHSEAHKKSILYLGLHSIEATSLGSSIHAGRGEIGCRGSGYFLAGWRGIGQDNTKSCHAGIVRCRRLHLDPLSEPVPTMFDL